MKNSLFLKLAFIALMAAAPILPAQDSDTIIIRTNVLVDGFPPPIPVHISGFSGEVDTVIKFDLLFMGFEQASPERARYLIQGKNSPGRVEGVVVDPIAKQTKLAKAFTGANTRAQVHALADDIAQTLTGKPGIAQTKIAFVGQPSGVGPGEIYVADYDGHGAQPVTQDGVIVAAPAWGGRSQVLYTSYKSGKPDIFKQNLATGARRPIARFNGLNTSVAVSPDGSRVAMILSKSGSPELYVSDIDGNSPRQLTTGKGVNASPCWSPNGRTLCYVSDRGGSAALYTIPAEGGAPSRLPTIGGNRPTEPDWSPDGKYIVFTSQWGDFAICLVPTEGPRRGQVTKLVAGQDPAWAPNSRAVIFTRSVNHRYVLSLLDVPSKQVKDIARISGSAAQPSWAR
jgi:TolB protein